MPSLIRLEAYMVSHVGDGLVEQEASIIVYCLSSLAKYSPARNSLNADMPD